ncbi:Prolyl oligopeptidase family protein [Paenimyroides ummariense]|uniref:Prolyl oligopeptidase family protein n=1 Tax=Paenimyroides ummariense TaxID=913024 RepID=A0A1I5FN91_9FLAO|nr:prolyl oligopeptidase family serine peptidase [Paenimyroides ummariense]SFO25192.1 Prolyl oligopeptidase family protein [Paenimyroides ummariense]
MGNINKIILFLLILVTYQSNGQKIQKESEKVVNHKITASGGKAAFFKSSSESVSVSMIIKDLERKKEYSLKDISNQTVLNDEFFIGWSRYRQKLYRITFKSGKIDSVDNVSGFHWNEKLDLVVCHHKKNAKVVLTTMSGDTVKVFDDVIFYSVSENIDKLVLTSYNNRIIWYDMIGRLASERESEHLTNFRVKRVLWSADSSAYLLLNNMQEIKVLHLDEKNLRNIAIIKRINEQKGFELDTIFSKARLLEGYLALGTKAKVENTSSIPKIWSGFTKGIPEKTARNLENSQQLLLVKIKDGSLIDFSEQDKLVDFRIGAYKDMIFSWEINKHDDFTREYPLKELFWYDQNTGQKKNIGFFTESSVPLFGFKDVPCYFYFKDGHWYLFNVSNQTCKNITAGSGGIFHNEHFKYIKNSKEGYLSSPEIFDDKIIIQEKYDVYAYDYKSDELKKITRGKELGRRYAVQWQGSGHQFLGWDLNFSRQNLNNGKLFLKWHTEDYLEEGISLVGFDYKVKDIIKDNASFSQVRCEGYFITVLKEKANLPPQLLSINIKTLKTEQLFQSNVWDTDAKDIKVDYLNWKDPEGRLTGALVRFPLNYDKNKSYPAVFRIYESKKQNRNSYEDPSMPSGTGFNYRDYVNDGYFVIEPDIYYNVGKPGLSALDSVETALNKVVAAYPIDMDRVGICGHSFGGYETNFIITQTNRFKAAASSAGVFDLESFYLTMNWETLRPDMWRMESQQWRMGKGMYEDRDAYRKNSPANFVENIKTPLLLVTGERDFQIDWQQSVKMFLAMKRLNKEVILLLYPDEAHSLIKPENKKDFSDRMKQWFDFKLKDNKKPLWMEKGLQ